MILLIDNYDSFVYNLARYVRELGEEPVVRRHDALSAADVLAMRPSHVIISPGPCSPAEAGVCVEAIQAFTGKLPLLGVCLGHQAIGAALGGKVVRAQVQMHGKISRIHADGRGVYSGLPERFDVVRYHSLAIDRATLPPFLEITSTADDGEIMGVRHRELAGTPTPLEGVQFHPESILSEHGHAMLRNFLELKG